MTIGVLYLARLAEGPDHFAAFADSYRKHPASIAHELVVVAKGFEAPADFDKLAAVFDGIPHRVIPLDDAIGFDIQAYRLAATQIDDDYVCCLNTFSIVRADDWLKKLHDGIARPGIGLVGATGSFESIQDMMQVVSRLQFVLTRPAAFDAALVRAFGWLVPHFDVPTWQALHSRYARLRRHIGDLLRRRPKADAIIPEHKRDWRSAVLNNPDHYLQQYPAFPNPHIRSNAFMVRRDDFLATPLQEGTDKTSGSVFESGSSGMSGTILASGRRLLVVGANGQGYELPDWPSCGAFRSGSQSNLLVSDNQTDAFDAMNPEVKLTHQIMTWGVAKAGAPPLSLLQVTFDSTRLLADHRARLGAAADDAAAFAVRL